MFSKIFHLSFFVLTTLSAALTSNSFAQSGPVETITLSNGTVNLEDGQMLSFRIPGGWRWVKSVYIQAVGAPNAAKAEVIVNGERRGDLMDVPPQRLDPNFSRDIRESAQSIEIRSVSGASRIFDVKVVVATLPLPPPPLPRLPSPPQPSAFLDDLILSYPANTQAQRLSAQAIELSKLFFARTQGDHAAIQAADYERFILPIKKVAGRCYGLAQSRKDVSKEVQTMLGATGAQMAAARESGFFDRLLEAHTEDEEIFNLVTASLALEKRIEGEQR